MDIFGILTMVGGLALFLYGMSVMGAGLEKLSGGRLERILEKLTSNPIKAVLLGAGVTAVIQSSSATTVMVVGFVNSGIMKLSQAIGIIMGANVGTTITAWILSLTGIQGDSIFIKLLKPASFTPILAIIGIFMYMSGKNDKKKDIGEILLGFAVLMFGMEAMSGAVKPLANVPEFTNILTMFKNPILGIVAGAVLTGIIQSSSASVGILQALSVTGAFTYGSVIGIIMGQNIGTTVTALLSSVGTNRAARRTAYVHLYFNIIGTVVFMSLYYGLNAIIGFSFHDDVIGAAGIAVIHTTFNCFTTLVLLPFTKGLEKLAYITLPIAEEEKAPVEDAEFKILDDRFLQTPAFAIEQCRTLVNKMADLSKSSFIRAMNTLDAYSDQELEEIIKIENRVDVYEDKIGVYLTKLSSQNLSYHDSQNVSTLMHCLTDIERISDHAVNVVESVQEMNQRQLSFSDKAKSEMRIYRSAVEDIVTRAIDAFINADQKYAATVEPLEEVIDKLNKDIKKRHMKRMRKGQCTVELGILLTDIATNFERVSDHCSNIAVCLIQEESDIAAHSYISQLKDGEHLSFEHQVAALEQKYTFAKEKED